ncbi:S8 family serine peptidase [Dactylosporangium sp. CA-233914]|uniref:S8 family serine peptidase n=1 Tax=Dactylosporangium sp. CA-233914 TaxID=3239934 RepID=UPI003D8F42E9
MGLGVLFLAALPMLPARADDSLFVKYYTVTSSYQAAPENLAEIAQRFLGTTDRAVEIFNLNVGREQADGGSLTDPAKLNPGWQLVLPWDAVGAGVQYGTLPVSAVPPTVPPATRTAVPRTSAPPGQAGPSGGVSRSPAVQPSAAAKPTGAQCSAPAASAGPGGSDWAAGRLALDRTWARSRGKGQLIAIVDSGVDGSLAQLTGHVAVGVDIVSGTGRGDTDCLGTGTAMAGIAVAQRSQGGGLVGVAPDATVMPVRVATTTPKAQPADQATAIEVAVASGATVIALGSYVDTNDTGVAKAIDAAARHDVVVVTGAALASTPVNPAAILSDGGVLRVGAIGSNGQLADTYRAGGVDVVAPGIDVTSLGIAGTKPFVGSGTQYAVAHVAGQVALVRSAFPALSAAQVAIRIKATASKSTDSAASVGYGNGVIDPFTSVSAVLDGEAPAALAGDRPGGPAGGSHLTGGRVAVLAIVALIMLITVVLLVLRLRLVMRGDAAKDGDPDDEHTGPPSSPSASSHLNRAG